VKEGNLIERGKSRHCHDGERGIKETVALRVKKELKLKGRRKDSITKRLRAKIEIEKGTDIQGNEL